MRRSYQSLENQLRPRVLAVALTGVVVVALVALLVSRTDETNDVVAVGTTATQGELTALVSEPFASFGFAPLPEALDLGSLVVEYPTSAPLVSVSSLDFAVVVDIASEIATKSGLDPGLVARLADAKLDSSITPGVSGEYSTSDDTASIIITQRGATTTISISLFGDDRNVVVDESGRSEFGSKVLAVAGFEAPSFDTSVSSGSNRLVLSAPPAYEGGVPIAGLIGSVVFTNQGALESIEVTVAGERRSEPVTVLDPTAALENEKLVKVAPHPREDYVVPLVEPPVPKGSLAVATTELLLMPAHRDGSTTFVPAWKVSGVDANGTDFVFYLNAGVSK